MSYLTGLTVLRLTGHFQESTATRVQPYIAVPLIYKPYLEKRGKVGKAAFCSMISGVFDLTALGKIAGKIGKVRTFNQRVANFLRAHRTRVLPMYQRASLSNQLNSNVILYTLSLLHGPRSHHGYIQAR